MLHLARTEWLKIKGYWAFWLVMGITILSYPGINYMWHYIYKHEISKDKTETGELLGLIFGQPFAFPEVWKTVAFFSSLCVFIPAVVVIMLVTNEYSYKTQRQNIIDGWSRREFITAKFINVLIISLIIAALYILVAVGLGLINSDHSKAIWSEAKFIPLFALQTFAQLSFAFLIGFLVRRAFIALGIFIFWFLIFENIIVQLLKHYAHDEGRFMPLEISDRIIPPPSFFQRLDKENYQRALEAVNIHILYTFILLLIIWGFCFWLNGKRDL